MMSAHAGWMMAIGEAAGDTAPDLQIAIPPPPFPPLSLVNTRHLETPRDG